MQQFYISIITQNQVLIFNDHIKLVCNFFYCSSHLLYLLMIILNFRNKFFLWLISSSVKDDMQTSLSATNYHRSILIPTHIKQREGIWFADWNLPKILDTHGSKKVHINMRLMVKYNKSCVNTKTPKHHIHTR